MFSYWEDRKIGDYIFWSKKISFYLSIHSYYFIFWEVVTDILKRQKILKIKAAFPHVFVFMLFSALNEVRDWETQHFTITSQGSFFMILFAERYYNILPIAAAVKWFRPYNINHLLLIIRIKEELFWSQHFTFPMGITIKQSLNSHLMVMESFSDITMWLLTNSHCTLLSWVKIICQDFNTVFITMPWVSEKN